MFLGKTDEALAVLENYDKPAIFDSKNWYQNEKISLNFSISERNAKKFKIQELVLPILQGKFLAAFKNF